MAVGRISGPLLSKNLLRDGVDLAFETDLLYLDVTNGRIGIKKATPDYELDVNGTARFAVLTVANTATPGALTISRSVNGSTISDSIGNIVIQAPVDSKIFLQNDTIVNGNLHATGNITAEGSVQIGNATGTDTLSLYADIVSNITPQTANQYDIGAPDKSWATGYFNSIVADAISSLPGKDVNIAPSTGGITNIFGNVRIWGDNPLGTAPVTANTLYVTMDGSDTNDGRAMDPSRACRTITGALRSPFYKAGTSIKVAAGRYLEDNPLRLKPYTSVIGSDLRTTVIEPINKTQDLFWLDSGNYLAQMMFCNGQSGLLPGTGYTSGTNRGAYATAFAPNYGGTKIDLYHSPYVQNCTNQSGPWLMDGTMFNPNQTVQIPEAVGTATWVANTTTMIVALSEGALEVGQSINIGPTPQGYVNARTLLLANKAFIQEQTIAYIDQNNEYFSYDQADCMRDIGLIVDSLITDLVFAGNGYTQSNFAGLQYWNQNGYTGNIAGEVTTTIDAVNYVSSLAQKIVLNDDSGTRYQSTVTQNTSLPAATATEAEAIALDFSVITSILTNGTVGVTDIIQPNMLNAVSDGAQYAANLLQLNRTYIVEEAIAYIDNQNPGFTYDQTKCRRDVGYMLDSVTFDVLYGGNRQAVQSGVYYYGFSDTDSAIANERPQTTSAYYRLKDIVGLLITNQPVVKSAGNISSQVTNLTTATPAEAVPLKIMLDQITEIINAGPAAASEPLPVGLIKSSDTNVLNAAAILQANKAFITSEIIGYIEQTYNNGFVYNQPKCYRDTGLIVDSIAMDLLYEGSTQSTFAGLQYWDQGSYTGLINTEITTTTSAINYVSALAQQIVTNSTIGTRYQSVVTQNTSLQAATAAETQKIANEFGIIVNILNNGTLGVTDIIIPNGLASTSSNIINAYELLQANRAYIQAEAVAFVESTKTPGFVYDQALCYRDVGYMIDSVSFDLRNGGNRQAIQSGVYYYSFNEASTAIPNQIPQTIAAYNHIRNIVGKILTGQAITPTTGNTATQTLGPDVATSAEVQLAYQKIETITDIINNGPAAADPATPIGLEVSTDPNVLDAYNLLIANKEFIQEETIAFVNLFDVGFVYNRAKCRRDIGIIVENIAYDIAFGGNEKTVESGLAYWNGVTSYISNEITETSAAFDYINVLAQSILANTPAPNLLNTFQTAPQVINTVLTGGEIAAPIVTKLIGIINDIIVNGPEVAPISQPGNGPDWGSVSAEVLLETNRQFIQNEIIAWINYNYPDFEYREDKCYRDTGLIIDAIAQDITLNANAKTIEAAVTYWTGNVNVLENASFGNKNQVAETIAAINRAKEVSLQVINNSTVTTTSFVFNSVKCARDTGLIVDGLAQDLLFGGSSQSTFSGVQYWNHGSYVGDIAAQLTTTTAAINYISDLAQKIVQNNTTGARYQSTVSQNTSLLAATDSEATTIANNFSTVTNILINGVAGVTDTIVPNNLTASGNINVQRAYNILQANVEYLKAEAIAWVEANKNFRYDPVKCARDSGLIVDSIVLDLAYPTTYSSQSTFAGLQYWNQNGYTGSIANELTTTTAAINYVSLLAQEIVTNSTGTRYQSTVTQNTSLSAATATEAAAIATDFSVITNIITTGTVGVTDIIVPNSLTASVNTNTVNAYALLQANREYIQAEAVAFVETVKTPGFEYDPELCYRDVGYMLDSVSFDLLHGGNRQAVQSGVYYYTFDGSSTAIPNEIAQTVAAFEFIKALSENLVQNIPVTALQNAVLQDTSLPAASLSVIPAVTEPTSKIIKIIENGPDAVLVKQPISLTPATNSQKLAAANILLANRAFIQAETIAYINEFLTFQYDAETCARDVGYIVNSVSFDLLYGGNRQSVQSGVYYWGYSNKSTSLPNEQIASTLAYQYMKSLISNIVIAKVPETLYQNTVTQTTNLPAATPVEVDKVLANIDIITRIINEGPDAAGPKVPINLIESNNQFIRNAVNLISANREFIKAEVIAYVAETQVSNDQIFLPFYDMGANATLSVTRNFDILTNIVANGPGVAPIISDGNSIFVKTGLSPDDIKTAPVVTAITTVSSGVYKIDISESTIGFGNQQPLYFGQTAVFPKLADDVPDRWQQRRINPIGSMGGSLVDGAVISDRSPINSFVYDAYTQVNQGGEGIRISNNGYAQLVSVFTIFCSRAVVVENGGIASITNSNSNFGETCLTAKGYGKREFSGYVKNAPILPFFPNGLYPQGGTVQVYVADPELRPSISLVMEVEPPEGFVNNQGLPGFLSGSTTIDTLTTGTIDITGVDNTGFIIGQPFYVRDQFGRLVDDNNQPYIRSGTVVADVGYQSITLNFPLNSGGGEPGNFNFFNLYCCGNAYYTVLSSTVAPDPIPPGTSLLPGSQNIAESSSTAFINSLAQLIIDNDTVDALQTATRQVFDISLVGGENAGGFITDHLDIISSILVNGPASAPEITKFGPLPAGAASAASLLNKNKGFIEEEVITFINQTIYSFDYNEAKCQRDTGLIVDALAQDLLFSTSSQSTFAGLQYWNQNGYTGSIANELTTTTAAINYVSTLSQQIVQGQTGTRYTAGIQITNLTTATATEAAVLGADFDVITNIITNGTVGVTDIIVPNSLTASVNTNTVNAYALLQANRAYIQAEAVAFVETFKASDFTYDPDKCLRDVGHMIDSVSFDLLYGGNRQAVQSGVYYYGFSTVSTAIVDQIPQTIAAYDHISSIVQQIVLGQPVTTFQTTVPQVRNLSTGTLNEVVTIRNKIDIITNIIENGPSVAEEANPIQLTRSTDVDVINAALILDANREFIQAETVAYINNMFTYNEAKCRRDIGFLIDALIYDLEKGGNYNAVIAGKSYYATTGTHHIVQLEESVTDPALFPDGAITTFYQRSYMSASGYLFEYVGAGTDYGSLPQVGRADPIQSKEVVQLNNGKVFFTSTDQNGDFRIGTGLVISQATGVLSGRTFTKSLFANLTPFILAIEGD
jgi:hypothetical protein